MSITLTEEARWRGMARAAKTASKRSLLMRNENLPPLPNEAGRASRPAIRARLRALRAFDRITQRA